MEMTYGDVMKQALDEFAEAAFWATRQMENFVDAFNDLPPGIIQNLELTRDYETLGCPYGKSKRGLKKWIKKNPHGLLDSRQLDTPDWPEVVE